MSSKSLQSQINALERKVERYHTQHKLLKAKVTDMARMLRALEPFARAEDRELFYLYVDEIVEEAKKRRDEHVQKTERQKC